MLVCFSRTSICSQEFRFSGTALQTSLRPRLAWRWLQCGAAVVRLVQAPPFEGACAGRVSSGDRHSKHVHECSGRAAMAKPSITHVLGGEAFDGQVCLEAASVAANVELPRPAVRAVRAQVAQHLRRARLISDIIENKMEMRRRIRIALQYPQRHGLVER